MLTCVTMQQTKQQTNIHHSYSRATWFETSRGTDISNVSVILLRSARKGGRDSAVGTGNRYDVGGLRFENRWRQNVPDPSRPAPRPIPPHVTMCTGFNSPGVKLPGIQVDQSSRKTLRNDKYQRTLSENHFQIIIH